jgi:hypothetical protein
VAAGWTRRETGGLIGELQELGSAHSVQLRLDLLRELADLVALRLAERVPWPAREQVRYSCSARKSCARIICSHSRMRNVGQTLKLRVAVDEDHAAQRAFRSLGEVVGVNWLLGAY